jgi:hypothetical protein
VIAEVAREAGSEVSGCSNPNPQGDAMKLQRMQKPRIAHEGKLGQAYAAAAEVISPIWGMIQWGNVPIFKILGGFFAVFLGVVLYGAHKGGWLPVWWNWIVRTLGFGAFVLGALTAVAGVFTVTPR